LRSQCCALRYFAQQSNCICSLNRWCKGSGTRFGAVSAARKAPVERVFGHQARQGNLFAGATRTLIGLMAVAFPVRVKRGPMAAVKDCPCAQQSEVALDRFW
jgi:hypothetical protein